jgi:short-subunit dehydrogenase
MDFKHSSVIITGGSKGIGLAIAKVFAKKTNRPLVLIARSTDDLNQARNECLDEGAESVDTLKLDITDDQAIGEIDFSKYNPGIVINNAGSFLFKTLKDTSKEEFNAQFHINVGGAFAITQALLPYFKKQDRALVVNICSVGAFKGLADSGAYSMSKHALLGYTRSLRKELMSTNIGVTAINLGQTFSPSWDGVDIDTDKLIDPEDVGRLIVALSDLSSRSVAEEIILMPQGGEVPPM